MRSAQTNRTDKSDIGGNLLDTVCCFPTSQDKKVPPSPARCFTTRYYKLVLSRQLPQDITASMVWHHLMARLRGAVGSFFGDDDAAAAVGDDAIAQRSAAAAAAAAAAHRDIPSPKAKELTDQEDDADTALSGGGGGGGGGSGGGGSAAAKPASAKRNEKRRKGGNPSREKIACTDAVGALDVDSLAVPALRAELGKVGLPTKGRKPELRVRLKESIVRAGSRKRKRSGAAMDPLVGVEQPEIDVASLKVAGLKDELKSRGFGTGGKKATLVKRLRDALDAGTPVELGPAKKKKKGQAGAAAAAKVEQEANAKIASNK